MYPIPVLLWNDMKLPLPFAVLHPYLRVAAYLYLTFFRNREFFFFITLIFRPCLFDIAIYRARSRSPSLFFMPSDGCFSVRSN